MQVNCAERSMQYYGCRPFRSLLLGARSRIAVSLSEMIPKEFIERSS